MTKAVGYITVHDGDEAEIGRLHNEVAEAAAELGLDLGEVLVERNARPVLAERPGFERLIDMLGEEEMDVMIIDWENVSPDPRVQEAVRLALDEVATDVVEARTPV
jgi:hypothetical protein